METWFLNHVLGWSLSVLLLGLPGPFGAGTPSSYSTSPVTDGFHHSAATDKLGNMDNNATSTSYSSESLSPSQRNLLLTDTAETHAAAAAGNFDTEQTQTLTETSSRSLEAINLSTEPITSTLVTTTEASSSDSISISSSDSIGSSSSTGGSSIGSSSSGISSSSSSSSGGISSSTTGGSGSSGGGIGSSSSGISSSSGGISSSTTGGSSSGGIGSSSTGGIGSSGSSSSTGGTGGISSSGSSSSTGGIGSSGSSSSGSSSSSSGGISSSTTGSIGSSSSSSGGIGSSSTGGIGSSSSTSTSSSSGISSSSGSSSGSIGSSSSSSGISSSSGSSSGSIGSSSSDSIGSSGSSSSSSSSGISSSSGSSSGSIGSSSSDSIGSSSSSSSSSIGSSGSSSNGRSSRDWNDFTNTDQMPGISHAVSWEARSRVFTEDTSLAQDSSDTTVRLGDATALVSQTADLDDNTYTTTISRAGERTLLSVTFSSSNSTSSAFTEDSNSHQPPSTWGIPPRPAETEDYTSSAASTRTTGRETTDQHMTDSFKGTFSETGIPVGSRGTQSLTGRPNTTRHQHTSTPEEIFDSTPPLRVTEPGTDQSEVSVSSTPPFTSTAGGPANISGTDQGLDSSVGASTESSSGAQSSSTQNLEGTEGLSPQTREDHVGWGLTAVPSTVSSSTSEIDASVTDGPMPVTEVFLTTTPATVTARFQTTEEETFKATAFTSTTAATTPPLVTRPSSTSSSSIPGSPTEATVPYTARSTTASTFTLQTSAAHSTLSGSPNQTPGLSTGTPNPTSVSTLQIETSTGTHRITTAQSQYITTTYTHSTPTNPTEAFHTTWKQADRGTTEMVVTTPTTEVQPTKVPPPPPPSNPCVSNPCMNGGMCVSYKGHQFTCHCQQAWTGQTCNQDMNECEQDPCPVGSRCVNTRGSFSCECPLGFDLEDGRTCSRAKTFLGTFSVNRLPHDPSTFKSATMHEIQREIIQLLNVSLSVLRGYSRSTLSKKEEDRVHILAVNMFSISTDVTTAEVYNSIQMSLSNCSSSLAHCRMALHHQLTYHMESLCVAQRTQCDTERSTCTDSSGTAHCQCLQGYYKHNPDDLSCLDCGDGYKFENGTCVPCMFGFGGFNCGNFYKLIAVVVSPAGGALLLILVIALIVTCCKKDKNDINKIIFKSGDLQMSPYADFPKNNRISMEWGRETIEMQENGSTKNLLQMTDIYYSPALRNSDLERNGLYPFTGLPGSRHSCIYPAQWNPSFTSDDSRRRDYF